MNAYTKNFDVESAQKYCIEVGLQMIGRRYQHFKGDFYTVTDVNVDEATGEIRVAYVSEKFFYRWSRTLENFMSVVDGGQRRLKEV